MIILVFLFTFVSIIWIRNELVFKYFGKANDHWHDTYQSVTPLIPLENPNFVSILKKCDGFYKLFLKQPSYNQMMFLVWCWTYKQFYGKFEKEVEALRMEIMEDIRVSNRNPV